MSTDINIKKRIDIQEEGVSITPDVNSINFIGAGVTASTIGDNVTVNVIGSVGATAYYLNETVTQAPYKEFSSIPTAAAEQTIATVLGVGATATIQSFQTPSGVPNTTNIPAGLWQFYLHFSGTFGDSWDVYAEVYKRDLGGIETLLLTTDTIPTTALSAIPTMVLTDGVFPASTVLTTDRIVVKVLATNTGVAGQTITFHTEGSTNYSVGTTTLNQVVPTGAVTSVTGTAPVVSSGGTTPAISMAQADSVTDGYLSSTDWNTFNNKVDDNIYTADGTLVSNRTVDLDSKELIFDNGSVGINVNPSTALHVNALAVPAGEAVARFGVTDSSGYVQIANGTGTNNIFAPLLQGRQVGTSIHSAIGTEGIIDPVDDIGTTPITLFKARLSNFTSPVTRPLFQFTSWSFNVMTMLANGNVGIGTATPGEKLEVNGKTKTTTFQMTTTPTSGYVLTSDASGNGSWQLGGSASGIFGIANTSGVYTFYSTLTLAMAAATAGQTIEQFADVTETGAVTIAWKNGVNFNGNGHTYTHSYAAGDSNTISNTSGVVSAMISNWKVTRTGRANGTSTDYVFYATVNSSVFSFNGVYFTSTYGNSFYAYGAGCSHFGTLFSVAFLNAIDVADSTVYNLSGESLSSGFGIRLVNTSGNYLTGISQSNYGIFNNGSGRVSNSFGKSTSSSGIYGGIVSNSYGISTSGSGLGAMTAYNCTGISVSGIGGDSIGGSNNSLISSSNNAWYAFFPGYAISNSAMTSTSNTAVSSRGSIIRNCVITSNYNNAAGRAISEWFNDSVSKILNCTLFVTNAAANCIVSPAGAVNMKIAGCIFDGSTTPIAANITQTVVNTEDNQGNILL